MAAAIEHVDSVVGVDSDATDVAIVPAVRQFSPTGDDAVGEVAAANDRVHAISCLANCTGWRLRPQVPAPARTRPPPRCRSAAASACVQSPAAEFIPVAPDQQRAAGVAVGAAAGGVVHVAGIDVAQAVAIAIARARVSVAGGVGGVVAHAPVGMEGGEMQRHVAAEFGGDPAAQRADFRVAVVLAGDQQRGDFQPDVGFASRARPACPARPQAAAAEVAVERLGERLQIHVRRIDVLRRTRPALRGVM